MGIKTTYVDDIDGSDLGEKATPVPFAFDGKSYEIFLSEDNKKKLADALDPFIKNAQSGSASSSSASSTSNDKEYVKKVRAWAIGKGVKFKAADGTMKPVGEKGRLHGDIFKAYDEAHPDD